MKKTLRLGFMFWLRHPISAWSAHRRFRRAKTSPELQLAFSWGWMMRTDLDERGEAVITISPLEGDR